MKGLNVKMVLALLCSLVIFSTVTGLNDELTKYNLRGYNEESNEGHRHLSKGKGSSKHPSVGKGKGSKGSSKHPSVGKGKGGKSSSKQPSVGKGKGGKKSSKYPKSGKGKGGKKSSKYPKSGKGKGGKKSSKKSGKGKGKSGKKSNKNNKVPTVMPTTFNNAKCGISNAERRDAIKNTISSFSDLSKINQNGSPQKKALNWLLQKDGFSVCPDQTLHVVQRYILAVVYFATDGDNWTKCNRGDNNCFGVDATGTRTDYESYLSSSDVCTWFGVGCSGGEEITEVVLGGYEFYVAADGALPDELFSLDTVLNISFDGRDGDTRNISGNIPSGIGNAASLQQLDIDRNNLTGDIPDEMFNLNNLLLLDLDNNKLSGPISNRFGELQELRFLTIGNNNFDQQALPDGISNLDKLASLGLQGSNLTGPIPASYNNLKSLVALDLSENNLNGNIDIIGQFNLLQTLTINGNNFGGNVPNGIWTNGKFRVLDLSNNGLTGAIANNVKDMNDLVTLKLANNNFTGAIPPLSKVTNSKLRTLTLENNNFDVGASVPAELCDLPDITITIDSNISCPGGCCTVVSR